MFLEPSVPHTGFEGQFKKRQKLKTKRGPVEMIDLAPPQVSSEVPVVFMPGFKESVDAAHSLIEATYNSGRRIVSFNQTATHMRGSTDIAEQLIEYTLDNTSQPQVDLLLHSMGGIYGTLAAERKPTQVRTILNVATAGMSGEQNGLALGVRFIVDGAQETKRAQKEQPEEAGTLKEGVIFAVKQILRAPHNALFDVRMIAREPIKILDRQAALKKEHGTLLGLITYLDDSIFPLDGYQRIVGGKLKQMREASEYPYPKGDPTGSTLLFDGVWTLRGNHFSTVSHSDLDKQVALIPYALQSLEDKHTNQQSTTSQQSS